MKIGIYFDCVERGPGKVISNLIKSFEENKIEYLLNRDGDKNIILQSCNRLMGDLTNCYLGPNIATLPIDNKNLIDCDSCEKIIVPSDWVKNLYSKWLPLDKIEIWPVGIDTELFKDYTVEKEYDFLIYYKRRDIKDLNFIINFLTERNDKFIIIKYGEYNETHFIDIISKSRFGIVIDNCESQGIAVQEMMSCNLPLLVWDVTNWSDRGQEYEVKATSIPYWDSICGVSFTDINHLEESFNKFFNQLTLFKPRKYILNNLSFDKSTNKLLEIINKSK
jgi:glycosyltransferase involved in cell wall biosynthesis